MKFSLLSPLSSLKLPMPIARLYLPFQPFQPQKSISFVFPPWYCINCSDAIWDLLKVIFCRKTANQCSFIFAGAVSGPDLTEDSCKMIVEMCTTLYTKQLKGENASDKQLCSMLHDYKLCLERSHNSCRGGSTYDTLLTVVSRLLNRLCSEHEESAAA